MFQVVSEYLSLSSYLLTSCIIALLVFLLSTVRTRMRNLPPGPMGLPIVGYAPFLTKMPHIKLNELASKYGNIFSLQLGNTFVVVLNNAKVIREAFNKAEFLARPPRTVLSALETFKSPFFSNGKAWQEQRRFALQTMRNLGFGKSHMEKHILDEIQYLLDVIKQNNRNPINIKKILTPSMSNNISSLVYGSRYKYDDPKRMFLDNTLRTATRQARQLSLFVFLPWLKYLPFARSIFISNDLTQGLEKFTAFMKDHITKHQQTLDPENIRDYIDGYLIEMKNRKEKDPETTFSEKMLTGSAINFFVAGTETVNTTVDWCLYMMAAFQDLQKKVHAEIDAVIGAERMPSWADQKDMPFTQAVLMEIQRWPNVVPVNLLRYCLDDTEVGGYNIPKGATIVANLWAVHHDPEYWEDPFDFKPQRFLSKDGRTIVKSDSYMPFSVGKRSCPGEILALIEVFLYFTSILQRFTVEIPENTPVSFEGELGVTYYLKPHKVCFKERR